MSLARFAGPLVTAGSVVLATSALAQEAHMDNGMMNVPTGTTQIAGSNRHEMDDHEMQMQSRLGIGMNPREHQLHMAGRQAMLTQKMSKELLLVALDVDRQRNLVSLRTSRHMFDETLEGLRYGNETLMLMKTTQEPVLDQLTRVDHIWPLFDAAITPTIDRNEISDTQVANAAELSVSLLDATAQTVAAYDSLMQEGRLYSMLSTSIKSAESLGMLTQKVVKEFLLVAYGYEVERSRQALATTYRELDQILNGLIEGNPSRRMLPAPTREIRTYLLSLQEQWEQIRPAIKAAANGEEIEFRQVEHVAKQNEPMLARVEPLIDLYESL